jgi:hypothetical protein
VHQVDHDAFLKWRGTSDVDILVQKAHAEKALGKMHYQFRGRMPEKAGAESGIYTYVKDENGETLTLGLREAVTDASKRDITERLLRTATTVDVYSVPVRVAFMRELIRMKQFANRPKDRGDIKLLKRYYPGLSF